MNKTYTYTFTTQSNTQDSALTYKVNWGDGSVTQDSGPNGGSKTFSHSWASSGIYTITFSAASPLNTLVLDVATLAVKVSTYITGTIQITSPVSGSIYKVGDTVSILWSMTPPGGVTIWLYRGNTPIATLKGTGVEASNQWTWVISSSLGITQTSSDYKIKIIGIDYPSISGETGYFTIAPVECLTSNDCKELSCTGGGHVHEVCENSKCVLKASCTTTPLVPTGQCLPDNTLVKLPDDPKVYVIKNCKKEWIKTAEEFKQEGYKWEDVKEVNSSVIQAYNDYLEATANLLRAIGQQKVYRVVDGKILWVPTIAAFNAQGLKWEDIQDVNESTVNQYPSLKLVRVKGDPKVYYLTESGLKRWIPTIEVFNSYNNKWEDVVELESKDVNGYSNNDLIKLENEAKVYKLENGKKRWIETIEAFNKLGLDWNKIAPVNQTELNFYPEGAVIE
jgi:Fe-S-cluster formation regulator IscX/YfhJ